MQLNLDIFFKIIIAGRRADIPQGSSGVVQVG